MWLQNWLSSAVWYMIVCCMGYYTVFSHIVIFCLADSVWETNFIYVTIKFCVNMTMRREWFLPTWHAAITRCPRSRSRRRASVTISPVVMEVPALIHYRVGEFWPPPPTPTPPFNPHLPLYRIWHFIHWTLWHWSAWFHFTVIYALPITSTWLQMIWHISGRGQEG